MIVKVWLCSRPICGLGKVNTLGVTAICPPRWLLSRYTVIACWPCRALVRNVICPQY